MATRGYFKLVNTDNVSDPYQKHGDMLIEAYHDGYLEEMLRDILLIPFKLAKMQSDGYGKIFATSTFFPEKIYPKEYLKDRERYAAKNFAEVLDENCHLGYYDLTWSSIYDLLQLTCYGKYQDIEADGVTRYSTKVGFEDAEFVVETNDALFRVDNTTISGINWQDEDEEEDDENPRDRFKSFIEHLNKNITTEDLKIKYDGDVVSFSITGVVLDLMYHKKWELKREEV